VKVFLNTNVLASGFATRWLCTDGIRQVLALALAAKADVLITGDKDLLDVAEQVSDLTITDPRGFWNLAKKRLKK
jgi:predicted nucleic acid-binding protein